MSEALSFNADRRLSKELAGPRFELDRHNELFPSALLEVHSPPSRLFLIGNPLIFKDALAVVGARKATPYGLSVAEKFAAFAVDLGLVVVSGGALGCDSAAHKAACKVGGLSIVVLGGGLDKIYPARNFSLFQEVIDKGGAVISEHPWDETPRPHYFRLRNRIIAGLAKATLIVEAGLGSGTFSTADEALNAGREVLAVPGSILAPNSFGSNRLIYQGATPVVDKESFDDTLRRIYGLKPSQARIRFEKGESDHPHISDFNAIERALMSTPLYMEELYALACEVFGEHEPMKKLFECLVAGEKKDLFCLYPDGRWGPRVAK